MRHINALREDNDHKMKEIFDKFEIVQEKLFEFDSEAGEKFAKLGIDDGESDS
jgi:hypothetical protein